MFSPCCMVHLQVLWFPSIPKRYAIRLIGTEYECWPQPCALCRLRLAPGPPKFPYQGVGLLVLSSCIHSWINVIKYLQNYSCRLHPSVVQETHCHGHSFKMRQTSICLSPFHSIGGDDSSGSTSKHLWCVCPKQTISLLEKWAACSCGMTEFRLC